MSNVTLTLTVSPDTARKILDVISGEGANGFTIRDSVSRADAERVISICKSASYVPGTGDDRTPILLSVNEAADAVKTCSNEVYRMIHFDLIEHYAFKHDPRHNNRALRLVNLKSLQDYMAANKRSTNLDFLSRDVSAQEAK